MEGSRFRQCPYCNETLRLVDFMWEHCEWCNADLQKFFQTGTIKFLVSYRGEFGAYIEAPSRDVAIEKFVSGEAKYFLVGDLWEEYIEVEPIE